MKSTARTGCATIFKGRTARGGKPPVPALETGQFRSCSPPNVVILESGFGLRCPLLYSLVEDLLDTVGRVATDHLEMAFWPDYETTKKQEKWKKRGFRPTSVSRYGGSGEKNFRVPQARVDLHARRRRG